MGYVCYGVGKRSVTRIVSIVALLAIRHDCYNGVWNKIVGAPPLKGHPFARSYKLEVQPFDNAI